jgi:hypothetical protein
MVERPELWEALVCRVARSVAWLPRNSRDTGTSDTRQYSEDRFSQHLQKWKQLAQLGGIFNSGARNIFC